MTKKSKDIAESEDNGTELGRLGCLVPVFAGADLLGIVRAGTSSMTDEFVWREALEGL